MIVLGSTDSALASLQLFEGFGWPGALHLLRARAQLALRSWSRPRFPPSSVGWRGQKNICMWFVQYQAELQTPDEMQSEL
ncbi:hypothetical protein BDA96_01G218100 [Sorghum bicolor]|uniref:Uncharacterized protein n=2 Tax=Sorghum bicolor TaxID=4558 RepID=A0A921RYK5_SORBI|nr:hypothetical protein BDA96_01G218100 [Sorghum bicolor]KXG38240.1 hypothetical protein SORBI_3001G204601 [Sorghum bicolor]